MAMPTVFGQSLSIRYHPSHRPKLYWSSLDHNRKTWLKVGLELQNFSFLPGHKVDEKKHLLQKILRQARKMNDSFLQDGVDVYTYTHLEFPLKWGLGSSATLIDLVAQWAEISPLELFFNISEGSGYDVACSQSLNPIIYQKKSPRPQWNSCVFSPAFREHLYFVYLNHKKDTRHAISYYHTLGPFPHSIKKSISDLTEEIRAAESLEQFQFLLEEHEEIVSKSLHLIRAKDSHFQDFPGTIKSLGAWGGDFVLVATKLDFPSVIDYFKKKGFKLCLPYNKMISPDSS